MIKIVNGVEIEMTQAEIDEHLAMQAQAKAAQAQAKEEYMRAKLIRAEKEKALEEMIATQKTQIEAMDGTALDAAVRALKGS
jgi:hypothetical protein